MLSDNFFCLAVHAAPSSTEKHTDKRIWAMTAMVNTVGACDVKRRRDFGPISAGCPAPHLLCWYNGEGGQQLRLLTKAGHVRKGRVLNLRQRERGGRQAERGGEREPDQKRVSIPEVGKQHLSLSLSWNCFLANNSRQQVGWFDVTLR